MAQNVEIGADLLGGIARDDRDPADNEGFAGGALPSITYDSGSVIGQVDGLLFDYLGDTGYGGALHLGGAFGAGNFVGVYGSISELERFTGLSTKRVGGEVRFTSGTFSLEGIAGYEHTERATFFIGTTATDDVYDVYGLGGKLFSIADAKFKPSDNLSFFAGHRYTGGRHAAAAGAVIGFGDTFALLLQGRAGEGNYKAIFAGLRLRFGGRTDGSPGAMLDNRLLEDLFAPANTRRALLDPLPPPPLPDDEDCGSCGGYCDE